MGRAEGTGTTGSETQDLQALLALHEVALGTMSHGLCMYDSNHRVVLFNQRFVEIFDLSPAVMRRGMPMDELFFHGATRMGADAADTQKAWERRIRKLGEGKPFEHRYSLPGTTSVIATFRPMPDGGWVAITEDVTVQQRMQQELRLQFERMDEALRNLPHGLSMYDASGRLIVCNAQYLRMFDLNPDVIQPGISHFDVLAHSVERGNRPPCSVESTHSQRMEVLLEGTPMTVRLETNRGTVIEATSRRMPSGGWITISEDVTARLGFEQALREQNLRFDAALANMAQGLCMFDGEQRLMVCNRPFLDMYGFPPESVLPGMTLRQLTALSIELGNHPGATLDTAYGRFRRKLVQGQATHFLYPHRENRTFAIRTQPMLQGGWVVTFEDITERERVAQALLEQNIRFDAAMENMAQGLSMFDDNQRLIVCNDQYLKMFNMDPAVVKPGITLRDALAHSIERGAFVAYDLDELVALRREAIASRETHVFQFALANDRSVSSTLCPMPNGGWVCTFEDITERRAADAARIATLDALREQHRRFDAALNNMAHGLLMVGSDRRVIVHNPRFLELFGLSDGDIAPGVPMREVMACSVAAGNYGKTDADALYDDYMAQLDAGVASFSRHLASGRIIHCMHRPMAEGGWVAIYEDVTEQRKAEEKIAYMARHDALTGLPNRVLFHERMAAGLERVASHGTNLAILCLDLDHFKTVNDTLGHPIGDRLLSTMAQRLIRVLGPHDTIARLGGDEFAILQASPQPHSAHLLAQRILDVVAHPVVIDGHEINSSVTIGIAIAPKDATDSDHLMKCADLALYRAKAEGRATSRFFELNMDIRLKEKRGLELDLRKALAAGEFSLVYQPQMRARDGKLSGMEALLRWHHSVRGGVPPSEFIPIAEETGLIIPLGEWVLRGACAEAAQWPGDIRLSVNLSPVQFKGRGLVGTVASALSSTGLPAHRLELEITEAVLLLDDEATITTLHQLRTLGVRISMDDFGTGYSSLSYLRSFPFDKIKIDRSFISDLGASNDSGAIIRAIASLGASLGIDTTAEGVETPEQLELVRRLGCTEVQGFYFSQPGSAAEMLTRFGHPRAVA